MGCAAALIVLLGLAAYADSLSGPFVFDDLPAIAANPTLRQLWPLSGALHPPAASTVTGRPLLNLSFALNYALGGTHVWSYHALNVVIHLLAGLCLFGCIRRTMQARAEPAPAAGEATWAAAAAAQPPRPRPPRVGGSGSSGKLRSETRGSPRWRCSPDSPAG